MFEEDFYPTPKNIIYKMLHPYLKGDEVSYYMQTMNVLEPSAGKGDIIDFIDYAMNRGYSSRKIKCLEINPNLQTILVKKDYADFVGSDFLNYVPDEFIDLIIMNPPFSNGDEHLLHAWEILKTGDIVCLLNKETIDNPFSKTRQKLCSIIEQNGTFEYIGNCFKNAERKTSVEVVLVRLHKSSDNLFKGLFDDLSREKDYSKTKIVDENNVVRADKIKSMVESYNSIISSFIDVVKTFKKFTTNIGTLNVDLKKHILEAMNDMKFFLEKEKFEESYKQVFNTFVSNIRKDAWSDIFDSLSVGTFVTSNVQKEFNKFSNDYAMYNFSEENIHKLIEILYSNGTNIMEQSILEAFDLLTKYHEENRIHWEGWKTNDFWRVNKKFILPFVVEKHYFQKKLTLCYNIRNHLNDLEKALCFISGKKFNEITSCEKIIQEELVKDNFKKIETTFFYVNVYFKGTGHFVFKDRWIWEQFNLIACKGKKWIPGNFDNFGDSNEIWNGKMLEFKE